MKSTLITALSALSFVSLVQTRGVSNFYCYSNDVEKPQKTRLSTKTAYNFVRGQGNEDEFRPKGCTPVKIWILSRHGTRLPSASDIKGMKKLEKLRDEIIQNYENQRTQLCKEDYELIKNWKFDQTITEDKEEYLTSRGWEDLRSIAEDYKNVFPEILQQNYDPKNFFFRHTNTERTQNSYRAFVEGLFGKDAYNEILSEVKIKNDTLLKPYANCPLWIQQDIENGKEGSKLFQFEHSSILQSAFAKISKKIGFDKPLNKTIIEAMWNECRFEQAWYLDKLSPWCTVFTLSDLKAIEYAEDLRYDRKFGYGSDINSKVACELVQDLLRQLSRDDGPRATAYFTHSTAIQLLLVSLGIAKDNFELKANNYEEVAKRKWRTSIVGPFAANLAVVKYNCSCEKCGPSQQVAFFLNQKIIDFDGCPNGRCKLSSFLKNYNEYYNADCPSIFCKRNITECL